MLIYDEFKPLQGRSKDELNRPKATASGLRVDHRSVLVVFIGVFLRFHIYMFAPNPSE